MRISRKSWHYRLNTSLYDYFNPNNLCEYFWKTVFALTIAMAIISMMIWAVVGLTKHVVNDPWGSLIFLSLIGCIGFPIIAIKLLRYYFPSTKTKQESLVAEYLKAKKNRICPMIEYYD